MTNNQTNNDATTAMLGGTFVTETLASFSWEVRGMEIFVQILPSVIQVEGMFLSPFLMEIKEVLTGALAFNELAMNAGCRDIFPGEEYLIPADEDLLFHYLLQRHSEQFLEKVKRCGLLIADESALQELHGRMVMAELDLIEDRGGITAGWKKVGDCVEYWWAGDACNPPVNSLDAEKAYSLYNSLVLLVRG